ncbi:MAG: hypothetical protein HC910_02120 [Spirulinaceae cyanobacterium SM2_1_0]|nr:hypothetical protein [Spirulinaceae cyanobacterium SM2_1_0]
MTNRPSRLLWRRVLLLTTATLLLSAAIAPPSQALFFRYRDGDDPEDFEDCARELLESGLPDDQVAIACAEALVPEDLSSCVSDIAAHTLVEANLALFACFRVRRPIELANCTVDITRETIEPFYGDRNDETAASARDALDRCRRSLLPERYASCVIGLSEPIALTPMDAMAICLEAEDFPRELYLPAAGAEL